jgi:protein MAK16
MQSDEMIWQVVNHQFCSFKTTIGKAKSDRTHFCRHPYSNTGLCNRTSCPLANSRYATLREDAGRIYLCLKTVERAHSPKNLWEKILLSRNYGKALSQLDAHLEHFPKVLLHRNKQRLTKIHQYLIRMRKIELQRRGGRKAALVGVHRKIDQRDERREKKALSAAKLERNIERELVERLARGTYGDIYNFPERPYQKALDRAADAGEAEEDDELLEAEEEMTETEYDSEDGLVEYVENLDEEEDEEEEEAEMEDMDYMGNNAWGNYNGDSNEEEEDDDDDNDDDEEASSGSSSSSVDDDDDDDRATAAAAAKTKSPSKKGKTEDAKKAKNKKTPAAARRGPRIEIEYEEEREEASSALTALLPAAADW